MIEQGDIERARDKLAQKIQKYSTQQVKLWNEVPYATLTQWGMHGWGDTEENTVINGWYCITSLCRNGYYEAFIDCETGLIYSRPNETLARTDVLLALNPKAINALTILNYLYSRAVGTDHSVEWKQREPGWRLEYAKEHNIGIKYIRSEIIQ